MNIMTGKQQQISTTTTPTNKLISSLLITQHQNKNPILSPQSSLQQQTNTQQQPSPIIIKLILQNVPYNQIQLNNKLAHSLLDTSTLNKNPLNLIQYQMHGEKSRHDPQMIQAKLRKLENRAEIHRAENVLYILLTKEIYLLTQQKTLAKSKNKPNTQRKNHNNNNTSIKSKQSYMKIYQSYLKQKQIQTQNKQKIYQEDQQQHLLNIQQQTQFSNVKHGIKYYNALLKHSKILDLTISRKKEQQGLALLQQNIQKKLFLSQKLKNKNKINIKNQQQSEQFMKQKAIQQQKQSKRYFQNPQKIIQRQLTKFYIKKNSGKLTNQAQLNERSQSLIMKQKYFSSLVDENKISKEDKKKLQSKLNDLANQLAKSDRRRSLEGLVLPQLKQNSNRVVAIDSHNGQQQQYQQESIRRKLFGQGNSNNKSKRLSIKLIQRQNNNNKN